MAKKTGARASAKKTKSNQNSTVDEVLGRLESLVETLEGGELPLEAALERFEEGVTLARQGSAMLNAVEQRVEVLLADQKEPVPFDLAHEEMENNNDNA